MPLCSQSTAGMRPLQGCKALENRATTQTTPNNARLDTKVRVRALVEPSTMSFFIISALESLAFRYFFPWKMQALVGM